MAQTEYYNPQAQSRRLYHKTALIESIPMSKVIGKPVFLKMDCFQPAGSFKIRGIGRLCKELVAEGKKHLISSSGGNAGYSVAYAGRNLGVDVTVFVPTSTHQIYIDQIKSEGAEVKISGKFWDEADRAAKDYVEEVGGGFIPPFDHPTLWAGHSTLIDELVTQCEKPGAVIVSVGGGGLACGVLEGMHRHGWDKVPLFCVEPEGAASLGAAMKADKVVSLPEVNTIITTLGTQAICEELFKWTKKHSITPLTVSDHQAVLASRQFVDDHRVLVEPACGAALAVVYGNVQQLKSVDSILVIACGGIGVSVELLEHYLEEGVEPESHA